MIFSLAIAFRAESNRLIYFVFHSVIFEHLVCDRLRLGSDPWWPQLPPSTRNEHGGRGLAPGVGHSSETANAFVPSDNDEDRRGTATRTASTLRNPLLAERLLAGG